MHLKCHTNKTSLPVGLHTRLCMYNTSFLKWVRRTRRGRLIRTYMMFQMPHISSLHLFKDFPIRKSQLWYKFPKIFFAKSSARDKPLQTMHGSCICLNQSYYDGLWVDHLQCELLNSSWVGAPTSQPFHNQIFGGPCRTLTIREQFILCWLGRDSD